MKPRRLKVAVIVAAVLVAVTTIVLATFATFSHLSERRREMDRLRRGVHVEADQLADSLALPIWNIDRPQIDKIVSGVGSMPNVYAIAVVAAGQTHARIRDPDWQFKTWDGRSHPQGLLSEERPIRFSGELIGTLRIYVTGKFVDEALRRSLWSRIVAIVLVDLLLSLSVYAILWPSVLRPLGRIEQYAQAVSATGADAGMPPGTGGAEELTSLGSSIHSMVHLLAESATEWRQTFDAVVTPILITDRDGAIRRFNRAALELAAIPEVDLVAQRVEDLGSGEPWSTAAQLVSSLPPHDSVASGETRDAQGRTWDVSITHFATPGEGADRFILVFWEITGIVELQESLRRSETLSAMGTLVAGVAHEVRNPLFGMSATLDAYQEELSRPEYEMFQRTLRREVGRLTDLMQELLEYGKPSVLSLARGCVPDVIDEAIESRRSAARTAGVELESLVGKGEAALLIDQSRLRQVFENLIDNAIQHSPPESSVRIRSRQVEHAGRRWVEILVEDEGRGFAPRDLDRVFEPFFTTREGGTGLGLSIVQRIVEEHSGKVSAANRPDGGAVVTILLPVADAHPAAKAVTG
jgi:signal transduction histidine kinase